MKNALIKNLILITLIALLIIPTGIISRADVDKDNYDARVVISSSGQLKEGENFKIYIKILDLKLEADEFVGSIEYDNDVFEKPTQENFVLENGWESITYNDESQIFTVDRSEATTEVGKVITINLKVKDGVDENLTSSMVQILDVEIAGKGLLLKTDVNFEQNILDQTPLYLKSQDYKIGNDDIHTYLEGDKYISRIDSKTTVKDFISKLDTNADKVEVLKEDGSEAKEDEYVGTGMTLKATKEDKDVTTIQVKIAVIGDLTGDGLVTATDLSVLKQTILNNLELTEEYIIAADIDESGKISATDLSEEVRIVLQ